MRVFVGVSFVVMGLALAGCPTLDGSCDRDAECKPGESCDLTSRACFAHDAGDDAGVDGGDAGATCVTECAQWQECSEGECAARYSKLSLTQPSPGMAVPGATITAKATLELAVGRTANAPQTLVLEVKAPGGMMTSHPMMASGEAYEASVVLGTAEGSYVFTAKYPEAGLMSSPAAILVDGTAPAFVVTVVPAAARPATANGTSHLDVDAAYATAHRRDEVIEVRISSTDPDVAPESVTVSAQFGGGVMAKQYPVTSAPSIDCGAGVLYCGVASVNAWEPQMKAFRDTLTLTAGGTDRVGNDATPATGTAKVTRWKWAHEVDTLPVKASPAIASDGTIIIGSTSGGTSGKLKALRPDGTVRWERATLGALDASPAVGKLNGASQNVYAQLNGSGAPDAKLYAFDLGGNEVASCTPPVAGPGRVSVAVHSTQFSGEAQPVESASTVVEGGSTLVTIRPGAAFQCRDGVAGGKGAYPAALAARGADVYFGDINGSVRGFSFTTTGWTAKTGWPVAANLFTQAVALAGMDVVGGGGPGKGGLFTIPETGMATDWELPTTSPAWNPVVGAGSLSFVGLNDETLLSVTLKNSSTKTVANTGGVVRAAPILGEGGVLFYGTVTGSLVSSLQSPLGPPIWQLTGLGALESSPNLDCSRDSTGAPVAGRPGVLYVGSTNGKLYSFIVDSRGIDTSAPWPKYQHDPRNTGNADTALSEFVCP